MAYTDQGIQTRCAEARAVAMSLSAADSDTKNRSLTAVKQALISRQSEIYAANEKDLRRASASAIPAPLLKRLKFDSAKLKEVCDGIDTLISLDDPIGKTNTAKELDSGLRLYQVVCPIGVIGIIFESRPDALVQISTLCLKSGNAVVLKGGTEASSSNRMLFEIIASASAESGAPEGWIQLAESRDDVKIMLGLENDIDLIVPRGSNDFVRYILDNTNIPVLGHADGICHVYVHEDADLKMAIDVVVDSKTQYVAVCNALETLLVHRSIAESLLPPLETALKEKQVKILGCPRTRKIIEVEEATDNDWRTEYLDLTLSIKVVDSIDEAIRHIHTYGSNHTDAIVSSDKDAAESFMTLVDSANVFWNCSTRFADGYRYGLGAEVGISTNKIHARGPVGLEGLVIYKWKLYGTGHIVAHYSGPNARSFIHRDLTGL